MPLPPRLVPVTPSMLIRAHPPLEPLEHLGLAMGTEGETRDADTNARGARLAHEGLEYLVFGNGAAHRVHARPVFSVTSKRTSDNATRREREVRP